MFQMLDIKSICFLIRHTPQPKHRVIREKHFLGGKMQVKVDISTHLLNALSRVFEMGNVSKCWS